MKHWLAWIFSVQHNDVDVKRRGNVALIVTVGLICGVAAFLPSSLLGDQQARASVPMIVTALVGLTLTGVMIRTGRVTAGVSLLTLLLSLVISLSMLQRGAIAATPFYFVVLLLVASVTLTPRYIWAVLALCLAELAIVLALLPASVWLDPLNTTNLVGSLVVMCIVAFIGYLGARGTEAALTTARDAQNQTRSAAAALAQANASLERRVAERTAALEQAFAVQQEQASELATSLERQQQLNDVISALSVPILPVQHDVLVVPLVGNIEAGRVQQLLQTVLHAIETRRARTVFLDVTGIVVVDTTVAQALLQTTDAARLLGAEPILVGVRPEMAQALASLGVELSRLRTTASLETGLALLSQHATSNRATTRKAA